MYLFFQENACKRYLQLRCQSIPTQPPGRWMAKWKLPFLHHSWMLGKLRLRARVEPRRASSSKSFCNWEGSGRGFFSAEWLQSFNKASDGGSRFRMVLI